MRNATVIVVFFNPCGYKKPVTNVNMTIGACCQPITCVELVYDDREPEVKGEYCDRHIVLRADSRRHVLWQKEALINYAMEQCDSDYLVWLDGDVIFQECTWLERTLDALSEHHVVQPFHMVQCMDLTYDPELYPSFAATYQLRRNPTWHAKPGYAFAWRRSLGPLIDLGVCGGGDRMMWNAVTGWWDHPLMRDLNPAWKSAIMEQSLKINMITQGDCGVAYNNIRFLTHGAHEARQYNQRFLPLIRMGFDPKKHLVKEGPIWAWTDDRFNDVMTDYFYGRLEDD